MSEWHIEQKQDYPTNYHFILNEQGATVAMVAHDRSAADRIIADHGAVARLAAAERRIEELVAALERAGTDLIGFEGYFERLGSMGTVASIRATLETIDAALATVPSEPSGGAEGERHESWCPASGGECSCDAPEFGPND